MRVPDNSRASVLGNCVGQCLRQTLYVLYMTFQELALFPTTYMRLVVVLLADRSARYACQSSGNGSVTRHIQYLTGSRTAAPTIENMKTTEITSGTRFNSSSVAYIFITAGDTQAKPIRWAKQSWLNALTIEIRFKI
jgi:hypothetical protein